MQMTWSAAAGLALFNALLLAAIAHWSRRARRGAGGDAPRWQQLDSLCTITIALMMLLAVDLLSLGGSSWRTTAAQAVMIGGVLLVAGLWTGKCILRAVEDRQDRRLRLAAGLAVQRRLWHPGAVAAAWFAGLLPVLWLFVKVVGWTLRRYYGNQILPAAEYDRLTGTVAAVFFVVIGLYLLAATAHVRMQVIRRRRARSRALEQDRQVLASTTKA